MQILSRSSLALALAAIPTLTSAQEPCVVTLAASAPAAPSAAPQAPEPCFVTVTRSSSGAVVASPSSAAAPIAIPPASSGSVAAPVAANSSAPTAPGGTLEGANLVLMPLGDSITFGFGSSDGNGYRAALYDSLVGAGATVDMVGSVQSGSMADPDNEGHSGWTIDQIAGAAASSAGLAPNTVLVHAGTNDANGFPNPEQMGERLTALLDATVGQWPDAVFLVAQIIPSTNPGTQANIDTFNAQIPDIVGSFASAGTKMAVVNMDSPDIELADSLHPSDGGYVTMAGLWFAGLEDAAAQGWF